MIKRVICFDYGIKFIGVAIGETLTKKSKALNVIIYDKNMFSKLEKILTNWKPNIVVVGLPLNGKGKKMIKKCKSFACNLCKKFKIPIELQDERLTSYEAKKKKYCVIDKYNNIILKEYKKHNLIINALSASIILEDWLVTN